jgi:hypothetical protein
MFSLLFDAQLDTQAHGLSRVAVDAHVRQLGRAIRFVLDAVTVHLLLDGLRLALRARHAALGRELCVRSF